MPLSQQQLDQFDNDGCLVIKNYLDNDTVAALNKEIDLLYTKIDLKTHPLTKFTTEADGEHIGDKYFFGSSDKVSYFFEPGSIDANGNLIKPVNLAINKIGHGLHFLNDKFHKITVNSDIASMCKQLKFKDPRALQSMVIVKQPEIGGEVPPHTDATFLYTDPISCVGFWFALEDCTVENGCLAFLPGSHKKYPVYKRMVVDPHGHGTKFVRTDDTSKEFVPTAQEMQWEKEVRDPSLYQMVEIPAGSLVLINGSVLHKSERNLSGRTRNAYTFHVVEGTAKYDAQNWLQLPPGHPSGSKYFTKLYT